jgi:formylmethanofuran dehydrogenase subunit A
MDKTIVLSASKGSDGYVAARGDWETYSDFSGAQYGLNFGGTRSKIAGYINPSDYQSNLTVKVYSARLVNATTIYCDGPCEWQVVEFY